MSISFFFIPHFSSFVHSLQSLALVFSFILWLAPAHSSLSSVCVLYPQVSQHAPPSPAYPRCWARVSHFSAGPYGRTPDSLVTPRRERAGRGHGDVTLWSLIELPLRRDRGKTSSSHFYRARNDRYYHRMEGQIYFLQCNTAEVCVCAHKNNIPLGRSFKSVSSLKSQYTLWLPWWNSL